MTLTRAFDLTGLSQATLEVWLWYDIEEDWDYAYIEVSTDAGQTWDILRGQYTTDSNPNGNSFGHAYSGKSGSADEAPDWVEEEIDLAPYVGQEILLRFEYITDGAQRTGPAAPPSAKEKCGNYKDEKSRQNIGEAGSPCQIFRYQVNDTGLDQPALGIETAGRTGRIGVNNRRVIRCPEN